MKHTGSALVVLLVGLLTACASTPVARASHEIGIQGCMDVEDYQTRAAVWGITWTHKELTPRLVAVFAYNFNNLEPISTFNITNLIVSSNALDNSGVVIGVFVDGCLYNNNFYPFKVLEGLMREPKSI